MGVGNENWFAFTGCIKPPTGSFADRPSGEIELVCLLWLLAMNDQAVLQCADHLTPPAELCDVCDERELNFVRERRVRETLTDKPSRHPSPLSHILLYALHILTHQCCITGASSSPTTSGIIVLNGYYYDAADPALFCFFKSIG